MKRTRSLLRRAACLLLAVCLIAPVFCFSASAARESTRIEFRAELPLVHSEGRRSERGIRDQLYLRSAKFDFAS